MESRLRISIVIPVYNEEDMIASCLDAVLSQAAPADEIIVVDNNSTDSTVERLSAYDGRIVVLSEMRQGVHYARNTGFDAASGDVIGRIDADTRLPAEWIGQILSLFADPTVDAATGPTGYYDILMPQTIEKLDLFLRKVCAWSCRQRLDWLYGANMAVRANAWHEVRTLVCEDSTIHEDVDLAIHMYDTAHRIIFSPTLFASTSARRIRDSLPDFRRYLGMTEHTYATHHGQATNDALWRARFINWVILSCYFPLNIMHRAHHPDRRGFWFGGLRSAHPARKNPMSIGRN